MSDPSDPRMSAATPRVPAMPTDVQNAFNPIGVIRNLLSRYPWPANFYGFVGLPVGTASNLLATYTNAADTLPAAALAAGGWANAVPVVNFTTTASNSVVEISVSGSAIIGTAAGSCASSAVIDGSTRIMLGGSAIPTSSYGNPFAGNGTIKVNNLAAGAHTVQIQVISSVANTSYLRAATNPPYEFLRLTVTEWRA